MRRFNVSNPELNNLLIMFENKVASCWQLDGEMQQNDWNDDKFFKMEKRARILQSEVDEARANLIDKIEELLT